MLAVGIGEKTGKVSNLGNFNINHTEAQAFAVGIGGRLFQPW
jgi:hypothetical protein